VLQGVICKLQRDSLFARSEATTNPDEEWQNIHCSMLSLVRTSKQSALHKASVVWKFGYHYGCAAVSTNITSSRCCFPSPYAAQFSQSRGTLLVGASRTRFGGGTQGVMGLLDLQGAIVVPVISAVLGPFGTAMM
jgi:hypothetical protein